MVLTKQLFTLGIRRPLINPVFMCSSTHYQECAATYLVPATSFHPIPHTDNVVQTRLKVQKHWTGLFLSSDGSAASLSSLSYTFFWTCSYIHY